MVDQQRSRFELTALALCALALLITTFWRYTPQHILFTNDLGLSFAIASEQLQGMGALVGPTSHEGARHLGPIYYWFVAVALAVGRGIAWATSTNSTFDLDSTYYAIVLMVGLKTAVYLSTVLVSLRLLANSRQRIVAAAITTAAIIAFQLPVLRIAWHSNDVLVPLSLAWCSFILALHRGWIYYPPLIVTATAAVLWHFASVPFAIGVCGCGAVALWKLHGNPLKNDTQLANSGIKRILLFSTTLMLLLAIHPIMFELKGSGNLHELLSHQLIQKAAATPKAGIVGSLELLINTAGVQLLGELRAPRDWTAAIILLAAALTITGGVALINVTGSPMASASPVAAGASSQIATSQIGWVVITVFTTILLYVMASIRLRLPVFYYFLNPLLPIFSTALVLAVGGSISAFSSRVAKWRILAGFFAPLYCLALITQAPASIQHQIPFPVSQEASLRHASEIAQVLSTDSRPSDRLRLLIRGPGFMEALRDNSVYYFLGVRFYQLMQRSQFFTELPRIHKVKPRMFSLAAEATDISFKRIYLLSCESDQTKREAELELQKQKLRKIFDWQEEIQVALPTCSTCGDCRLERFSQRIY